MRARGGAAPAAAPRRLYRRSACRGARRDGRTFLAMSCVRFEIRDHVARVTLDRPTAMNAVDLATEQALERIWTAIEGNDEVRAVVLTGVGERAFCAGADMKNSGNQTGL